MARILLAEDEADLNDLIAAELRNEGHEVTQAFDGTVALAAAEGTSDGHFMDLLILDWMLPGLDGLSICRRVRRNQIVPIIMLTARGEEADIVLGLEVGADDYLTKPFRMGELLARVRAILRRNEFGGSGAPIATSESAIVVNLDSRLARSGGEALELTPREFDLLALFVANPGRAFSREYLLERVWASDYEVTDRTVDTHVQRLRKKLGERASSIQTVWGIGYRFSQVRVLGPES